MWQKWLSDSHTESSLLVFDVVVPRRTSAPLTKRTGVSIYLLSWALFQKAGLTNSEFKPELWVD